MSRFAALAFTLALPSSALAFDETRPAGADDGDGAAGFELPEGFDAGALPLVEQTTNVDVAGVVARIRIEQLWQNASGRPLEITYVFPTSTRAALHDLRLRIGDERELRAEIRAKEQAQKLFDEARQEGKTAGLLQQQRPNAVTMKVTNVMPGERIRVTIEASEIVRAADGVYELVLPQTLGPRYTGNPGSEEFVENGYIAPASSTVSTRLALSLRSPIGIKSVGSPSHAVAPLFDGPGDARIAVESGAADVVADRDFVLRWKLAGERTETGVLLFRDREHAERARSEGEQDEHFFLLLGEPPTHVNPAAAPPREIIFVVDVSGSMSGFPLETAKRLVRELTGELRERDRFNMMFFSGGNKVLSQEGSVDADAGNLERALHALDRERGGGSTELIHALERALALPRGKPDGIERSRMIVVITDGFVSAERKAFDVVRDARGDAAVFAFGIGSSVNRQLIEGLAAAGGTESFVMLDDGQARRAVDHFRAVARPALTNVSVTFEGFSARDVEPPSPPDIYPGRALVMLGKFKGASGGRIVVSGDGIDGERYRNVLLVEDHLERPAHAPLRQLWARERVARLADRATPTPEQLAEVERLGLRYRLLTERTSFVVVDPKVRNTTGEVDGVAQPSIAPLGVEELGASEGAYIMHRKATGGGSLMKDVLGGLRGSSMGDAGGSGGLGLRGAGGGGGGVSGLFGAGGLGTGTGRGSGGSGNVDLGGRGKGATRVVPGKIIYEGSLSREEIQRVITRVMSQIKYCYEKQLTRTPDLAGKLVLSWTINGDGTVSNVVVTRALLGAGGVDVGTCTSRIVSRLVFPSVRGGGQVHVTYPFVFESE